MKSIFVALATIALVGTQVNAVVYDYAIFNDLFALVCADVTQTDGAATPITMYSDNSIFQVITGFGLGTQVEPTNTGSSCFTQSL